MSNSGKIYEVKCPSCGAPLPMSGQRVTCNYCGAALEREQPAVQQPVASPKPPEPQVIVIQSGSQSMRMTGRRKSADRSVLRRPNDRRGSLPFAATGRYGMQSGIDMHY